MSSCCGSKPKIDTAKMARCPECGDNQRSVSYQTVLHHMVHPDNMSLKEQAYYFCVSSACPVVYFSRDDVVFTQEHLREAVGQKTDNPLRTVCYCFDVTAQQVIEEITRDGHSASKEFVITQTKRKHCACEVRNPSGRCCLIDFPKAMLSN